MSPVKRCSNPTIRKSICRQAPDRYTRWRKEGRILFRPSVHQSGFDMVVVVRLRIPNDTHLMDPSFLMIPYVVTGALRNSTSPDLTFLPMMYHLDQRSNAVMHCGDSIIITTSITWCGVTHMNAWQNTTWLLIAFVHIRLLDVVMALPSIQELQKLTRQRVLDADKQNTLQWVSTLSIFSRNHLNGSSNLTPKLLRRGIEKEFDLDEGDLDAAEYRSTIKQAIEATMVLEFDNAWSWYTAYIPFLGRDRDWKESRGYSSCNKSWFFYKDKDEETISRIWSWWRTEEKNESKP